MLKKPLSLEARFWIAIFAGVIVFLSVVILYAYLSYQDRHESIERATGEQHNSGNPNDIITNLGGSVIVTTQNQTKNAAPDKQIIANEEPRKVPFFEAKITDLALIFFTYCLVVVGWVTVRSSEHGTWAIERPRVRLSHLKFSRGMGDISDIRNKNQMPVISVGFKNYGRTVAIVTRVRVCMTVIGTLPDKPEYSDGVVYVPTGQSIAPDAEYELPPQWFIHFGDFLADPDSPLGKAGFPFKAHFWVYGYIAYLDHLDSERTHGFIGMWMPPDTGNPTRDVSGESFFWGGHQNYSYDT